MACSTQPSCLASLAILAMLATLVPGSNALLDCPADISSSTLCEGGFKEGQCPSGYMFKESILGCGLCGGCVKYKGLDESCSRSEEIPELSRYTVSMVSGRALVTTDLCGPGLECGGDNRCELAADTTQCLQLLHTYRTEGITKKTYMYEPVCEPDGTFAAVQCQTRPGSFMYCFCVRETGERIDGRDLATNRESMNCACARKVVELKAAGRQDVTLHCLPNGNYEPLQCDQEVCFCVNSTTAQPYGGTVSRDMWKGLPCYDAGFFPGEYERLCDSMNKIAADVEKLLTAHGMQTSQFYRQCDPDGGYNAKVCTSEDQMCRCRDKAGNPIAPYVVDSSHDEANSMNCRCARDHNDKDPISIMLSTVKCDTTGNYQLEQCVGTACYCVDDWGERSSLNIQTDIAGVGDQARCCLPCLKPNTLDCTSDISWKAVCPEEPPNWKLA